MTLFVAYLRSTTRFSVLLVGALLVSYAIFLFMYSFIYHDEGNLIPIETYLVETINMPEPEPEKPPITQPKETTAEEMPDTPSLNLELMQLDMPLSDMAPPEISLNPEIKNFDFKQSNLTDQFSVQNVSSGTGTGIKQSTGLAIKPYASVQPNIPEIAWVNRINGWVEVSFVVDEKGKVGQVLVLDADPKGVFEEEVIAAVRLWGYPLYMHEGKAVSIRLIQKIELFWKDYPSNRDY